AALDHEVADHAVEDGVVVMAILHVLDEVGYGFRRLVGEQLQGDGAVIGVQLDHDKGSLSQGSEVCQVYDSSAMIRRVFCSAYPGPRSSQSKDPMSKPEIPAAANFLRPIVQADLDSGKHSTIITRFPPEPNGYLHIGHAKSICLNFGLAEEFGGQCNLRFDDTNPAKEDQEYIDAIKEDVRWLGFQWAGEEHYASDYFEQLHDWAIHLIKAGKAYVCDLSPEEAREYRGNL